MKYSFSLIYDLDTSVAVAVAAYLDAEHYAFLHLKYAPRYQIQEYEDCKSRVLQTWSMGWFRFGQRMTCEYVPPARLLNYDIEPDPWWFPSIYHLVNVRTDLRYYPDQTGTKTVSDLEIELDLAFWLWPFRHMMRRKMERMKIAKDMEDIAMIKRRDEIFGRDDIKPYLAKHQFLLYKDRFVEHFGGG